MPGAAYSSPQSFISVDGSLYFIGENLQFGRELWFIPSPSESGDFNHDDHLDRADYEFWRAIFGATTGIGQQADGNRDGVVDAADYTVWRDRFSVPATSDKLRTSAMRLTAAESFSASPTTEVASKSQIALRVEQSDAERTTIPTELGLREATSATLRMLDIQFARPNWPARSRGRLNSSNVVNSVSDQLLLLLAINRVASSSQLHFTVNNSGNENRDDHADDQDLANETLDIALESWG